MNSSFGIRQAISSSERSKIKRITGWVQNFVPVNSSQDEVQTIITEVQCNEENCVPIETLVILNGIRGKWMSKILKPVAEVDENDIAALDIPTDWEVYLTHKATFSNSADDKEEIIDSQDLATTSTLNEISSQLQKVRKDVRTLSSEDKIAIIKLLHEVIIDLQNDITVDITELSHKLESNTSTLIRNPSNSSIPPIVEVKMTPRASAVQTINIVRNSNNSVINNEVVQVHPQEKLNSLDDTKTSLREVKKPVVVSSKDITPPVRHSKGGSRPRGCPCCDPDNIDNIVDKLLFMDAPP